MGPKIIDIAIYATAALLAVSVFLPITSLPVIGDVSYNRVADIESYLVILFCVSAPILLFLDKAKFVVASAAGVWLTLLFPAIRDLFKSDDGGFLSKAVDKASGAMQDFAADLFLNIADFSWGGYVFLIALLGFTAACIIRAFK
ncbi:MAG: hypothetical protein HOC70_14290 [Gammaproteobacteria bacterium]|jgi:hypothetical protein|nr:hypothetical protein [Gammaproteobacteria bacterium]MBT4494407.1 hypothetical protein [Gammaproteobacteria bacterium]MBT7369299.1 hypothetical protein [Gammaproteobacteria bacterium]